MIVWICHTALIWIDYTCISSNNKHHVLLIKQIDNPIYLIGSIQSSLFYTYQTSSLHPSPYMYIIMHRSLRLRCQINDLSISVPPITSRPINGKFNGISLKNAVTNVDDSRIISTSFQIFFAYLPQKQPTVYYFVCRPSLIGRLHRKSAPCKFRTWVPSFCSSRNAINLAVFRTDWKTGHKPGWKWKLACKCCWSNQKVNRKHAFPSIICIRYWACMTP